MTKHRRTVITDRCPVCKRDDFVGIADYTARIIACGNCKWRSPVESLEIVGSGVGYVIPQQYVAVIVHRARVVCVAVLDSAEAAEREGIGQAAHVYTRFIGRNAATLATDKRGVRRFRSRVVRSDVIAL